MSHDLHRVMATYQVVEPVIGVLVLKVGPARPHLMIAARDIRKLEYVAEEGIKDLVQVVVVPAGIVLDGAAVLVPPHGCAVAVRCELASKDLRALAKGLATLPDPLCMDKPGIR